MNNEQIKNWISNVLRNLAKGNEFSDSLIDEGFNILLAINNNKTIKIVDNSNNHCFLDSDQWSEIQKEILNYNKIPAIKMFKNITKWGLLESKQAVENPDNWQQPKPKI